LVHAFPPRWLVVYCEGLITQAEAYNWYLRRIAESEPSTIDLPRVPAAVIDRHDVLMEIEAGVQQSPGVLLVGDEPTPRKRFIELLSAKIPYDPRFNWGAQKDTLVIGYPLFGDVSEYLQRGRFQRAIFALNGNQLDVEGWSFSDGDLSRERVTQTSLNLFRSLARVKPSDPYKFVVGMSPQEYRTLLARVPEMGAVPVIHVPPPDKTDLLLEYLAHLPVYQDGKKLDLGLGLLLDFLSGKAAPEECLSLAFVPHLLEWMQPGRENLGLPVPSRAISAIDRSSMEYGLPVRFVNRASRPFAFVERKMRVWPLKKHFERMLDDVSSFFEQYIGDVDDLQALIDIHYALTHMTVSELSPVNVRELGSVAELRGEIDKKSSLNKENY
jgi:hypothetical protein